MRLRAGSLFSGIGAFDLALERAGMEIAWQVEIDPHCRRVLERHWPEVRRYGDVRAVDAAGLEPVDVVAGGDPCQHRSRARSIWGSRQPDLWPEFLRIVQALRPLWVLREHVVSKDADECWAELVARGYDAIILEADSAQVTGQSRPREYLVGVLASAGICPGAVFSESPRFGWHPAAREATEPVAACLTTHPYRMDSRDNYVFEPGRGVRILAPVERERLQGLPDGWTAGLSDRQRARVVGNAVTVPVAQWIAERIAAATAELSDHARAEAR